VRLAPDTLRHDHARPRSAPPTFGGLLGRPGLARAGLLQETAQPVDQHLLRVAAVGLGPGLGGWLVAGRRAPAARGAAFGQLGPALSSCLPLGLGGALAVGGGLPALLARGRPIAGRRDRVAGPAEVAGVSRAQRRASARGEPVAAVARLLDQAGVDKAPAGKRRRVGLLPAAQRLERLLAVGRDVKLAQRRRAVVGARGLALGGALEPVDRGLDRGAASTAAATRSAGPATPRQTSGRAAAAAGRAAAGRAPFGVAPAGLEGGRAGRLRPRFLALAAQPRRRRQPARAVGVASSAQATSGVRIFDKYIRGIM